MELSRKQIIWAVAVLLIWVGGLFIWISSESKNHTIPLSFHKGSVVVHDLTSLTTIKALPVGTQSPLNGAGSFKAQMVSKIFSVSEDEILVGIQFDKIVYELNSDPVNQAFIDMYSIPFLVTIKPDGRIVDTLFSNTMSISDEDFLNTMIYYFDMVQELDSREWNTQHTNLFGDYEATYSQVNPNLLSKTITKYTSYDQSIEISIEESNSSYSLDNNRSWFESFEMNEKDVITIANGSTKTKVHTKVSATPSVRKPFFNLKLLSFDSAHELRAFLTEKKLKEIKSIVERINDYSFQQDVVATGVDALAFAQLFMDGELNSHELKKKLLQYLQLYPDKAYELLELIRQKKVNDRVAMAFIGALAEVGHYQAQKALQEIIWDDSIKMTVRQNAGIMVGFLKYPNDETISELWEYYDLQKTGDELFNSSLALAIGNFGERNSDLYDKVSDRLKKELDNAKDENTMGLMLNSLGNTQNPDIIKSVEPYAYHDEALVRKAAIKAIGKIKGDDKMVVKTIHTRMKDETSSDVIAQMGVSLEDKDIEKDVLETAATRLEYFNPYEGSVDPTAMIKTVANNVDKSQLARKKLLLMMGQNFDPRVKNEIIKGLNNK